MTPNESPNPNRRAWIPSAHSWRNPGRSCPKRCLKATIAKAYVDVSWFVQFLLGNGGVVKTKRLEHSSHDQWEHLGLWIACRDLGPKPHFEIGLVSIRSNRNTLVPRIIFQGSQNKQTISYTYKIDPGDWDGLFFDLFMSRPNAGLSAAPDEPRKFS